jgi:DNA primase
VLDDLLGSGLAIRVATVPAPHDPDSFIKTFGPPAFQELIAKAEGFFDYYLNRLCRINDIGTDKGRQTVLAAMVEALQKTRNSTLIEKYSERTAGRLGLSTLTVRQDPAALVKQYARPAPEPEQPKEPDEPRPNLQEFWLLKILLQHDELLDWSRQHFHLEWLQHAGVRTVLEKRFERREDGQPVQPASILDSLPPSLRSLVTEALIEERHIPNLERQAADLALRLRNGSIDREMAVLNRSLAQPGLTGDDTAEILQEIGALRAAKKAPI